MGAARSRARLSGGRATPTLAETLTPSVLGEGGRCGGSYRLGRASVLLLARAV